MSSEIYRLPKKYSSAERIEAIRLMGTKGLVEEIKRIRRHYRSLSPASTERGAWSMERGAWSAGRREVWGRPNTRIHDRRRTSHA